MTNRGKRHRNQSPEAPRAPSLEINFSWQKFATFLLLLLLDAGRCWWMLVDAGGCWWMLVDAGGCWWMLVDAGECWWMLVDAGGCWWMLVDPNGCLRECLEKPQIKHPLSPPLPPLPCSTTRPAGDVRKKTSIWTRVGRASTESQRLGGAQAESSAGLRRANASHLRPFKNSATAGRRAVAVQGVCVRHISVQLMEQRYININNSSNNNSNRSSNNSSNSSSSNSSNSNSNNSSNSSSSSSSTNSRNSSSNNSSNSSSSNSSNSSSNNSSSNSSRSNNKSSNNNSNSRNSSSNNSSNSSSNNSSSNSSRSNNKSSNNNSNSRNSIKHSCCSSAVDGSCNGKTFLGKCSDWGEEKGEREGGEGKRGEETSTIFHKYQRIKGTQTLEDPRLWWRTKAQSYPSLATLARTYLACPSSSVASERLCSGVSIIYDERSRVAIEDGRPEVRQTREIADRKDGGPEGWQTRGTADRRNGGPKGCQTGRTADRRNCTGQLQEKFTPVSTQLTVRTG
ncbi:HAT C-terminal dimerization domain [Trinorchestia longiramus]|nr:HAT C-terminal dimerization domain [Trinorchestia longiramus]